MRALVAFAIIVGAASVGCADELPAPQQIPYGITLSGEEYAKVINYINRLPRGEIEALAQFLESKEFEAQKTAQQSQQKAK
jgi:hypothetical protein